MKKNYFLFLLAALLTLNLSALTYTSTANGNWMSFTTWTPFGVPLPGDVVIINHAVALDTSFAYTSGSITVNASGSLIQNSPVRDIWVNGVNASFTNAGIVNIRFLLLSAGSFTNSGNFNVKAIENHITANNTGTGVILGMDSLYNLGTFNNQGAINVMTFYNNNTMNNYGTIKGLTTVVDSMYNNGTFLNDAGALIQADSCTNGNTFTNNGVLNFDQFTNSGSFTNSNYISFVDMTNMGVFTNQDSLIGTGSMTNAWVFTNQVGAVVDLGVSFLNIDTISTAMFTNDGFVNIGDSYYNFDVVTGSATGSFVVQDTSYNASTMSGSFDFCDLTPPPSSPYVDFNLGSIDPAITYCLSVGTDVIENGLAIKIFPNPTSGLLSVVSDKNVTIEVYNVLGENIITTIDNQIDLTSYQNGIYFVLLKDESGNLMKQERIVKQ